MWTLFSNLNIFNTIIYKYNDVSALLVQGLSLYTKQNFFPFFEFHPIVSSIEPLNGAVLWLFFKIFPTILAVNMLAIVYGALSLITSYLLFNALTKHRGVALIFAFFYTCSVYYLYRVISFTPNLYQICVFPLVLYLLGFKQWKPWFYSLLVFGIFGFSFYYGYFSFVIVVFWYCARFFVKEQTFSSFIKDVVQFLVAFIFLGAVAYAPLLVRVLPYFSSIKSDDSNIIANMPNSYRPIDDFYNLSLRPWYFFIPPKDSVLFGDFSKNTYAKLEATNYYLANDYDENEAAGTYLGWHLLLGSTLVVVLVIKKSTQFTLIQANSVLIKKLVILGALILLVSHPPSFSIAGFTFYTPTFLIYKVLPIFRTLVRFALVLYLIILCMNALFIADLMVRLKRNDFKILVCICLVVVHYALFAVHIPLLHFNKPPADISFIQRYAPEPYNFAVYPYGNYSSMTWVLGHNKKLINPKDYVNFTTGFDSNKFSVSLVEDDTLQLLHERNAKLLIVYTDQVKNVESYSVFVRALGRPIATGPGFEIYEVK